MNKSRAMLCTAVLLVVAFGGTATAGTSVSFMAAGHTTDQSAVFGSYLVSLPDLGFDTAISVSNVLMSPKGANVAGGYNGYDMMGTLEIYLYQGGEMMMVETSMDSPGTGLTDGMLGPGETYTVLLSELVDGGQLRGLCMDRRQLRRRGRNPHRLRPGLQPARRHDAAGVSPGRRDQAHGHGTMDMDGGMGRRHGRFMDDGDDDHGHDHDDE